MSTSQMPTPGPPLREREGMMRRWRVGPLGFEEEVEAVEGPASGEGAAEDNLEGPAAAEEVDAFTVIDAAAAAVGTPTAVGADARLGIQPTRRAGGEILGVN
jgi:hypothetical protein